ncbi:unnamed protein product [Fraxinus pennsylvanica]|uniref:Uncharacterized protein n=1 Tax=Fraxinus pennsylvanica TaxID=56036 RepID=A0AAD2ECU3_9LAMI|nr:unnamed protein product [Fraxinus pennsylvanica]
MRTDAVVENSGDVDKSQQDLALGIRPFHIMPKQLPRRACARASRIHAATSFTAAADAAILSTSVVKSFSSAKIRAKTGNAVIERANIPFDMVARRTNDEPIPNANGRLIPAMAMLRAFLPVLDREFGIQF